MDNHQDLVTRDTAAISRLVRWLAQLGVFVSVLFVLSATACGGSDDGGNDRLLVVTTVSPIRNIIENVGGDHVDVVGLVPEGTNSHTFEPAPSAARVLAEADLVIMNGLNLELPTLELARASTEAEIVLLGDTVIPVDQYVFGFSFPETGGNPNPHAWTELHFAIAYAEVIRNTLVKRDPEAAAYYSANLDAFRTRALELDRLFAETLNTIPPPNRKLLTYHDSFPYFGLRYGLEIIGAIEPSDFSEPAPQEVATLIAQIREVNLPTIFGSEVFPSSVLNRIAEEAGAVQVSTLRDDDLPGEPGDPTNTYFAMMVENVRAIAQNLGGDIGAMDGADVSNTWIPSAWFDG